jgi:hypothetical protein
MQLAHLFQEADLGIAHVGQGLIAVGPGKENQKVDGVAGIQGHADLGILLGPADAGAVTGTRVEYNDRPAFRFGAGCSSARPVAAFPAVFGGDVSFARSWPGPIAAVDNANQGIVGRPFECTAVHDHFVVEYQYRRLVFLQMLQIGVSPLAQDVGKQDGALGGIDPVFAEIRDPSGACLGGSLHAHPF